MKVIRKCKANPSPQYFAAGLCLLAGISVHADHAAQQVVGVGRLHSPGVQLFGQQPGGGVVGIARGSAQRPGLGHGASGVVVGEAGDLPFGVGQGQQVVPGVVAIVRGRRISAKCVVWKRNR